MHARKVRYVTHCKVVAVVGQTPAAAGSTFWRFFQQSELLKSGLYAKCIMELSYYFCQLYPLSDLDLSKFYFNWYNYSTYAVFFFRYNSEKVLHYVLQAKS